MLTSIQAERTPLERALKLMILIHVGGDLQVHGDDAAIEIMKQYGSTNWNGTQRATPCFIRAQLGPVFSQIAHEHMKQILRELEALSPSKDWRRFPLIVSTFAVLFAAMESLQYHVSKIPYHSYQDAPEGRMDVPVADSGGSDILLRFYRSTQCHAQLRCLAAMRMPQNLGSKREDERGIQFLRLMQGAIQSVQDYLENREQLTLTRNDMTHFFDRLLAKMYLSEYVEKSPRSQRRAG